MYFLHSCSIFDIYCVIIQTFLDAKEVTDRIIDVIKNFEKVSELAPAATPSHHYSSFLCR